MCDGTAFCKQCFRALDLCAVLLLPSLLRAVACLQEAPGNKNTTADTETGGAGGVHGILGTVSERSVSSSAALHAPTIRQPGGSCAFPPAAHRRLSKARSECLLVTVQPASSAVCRTAAGLTSAVTDSLRLAAARGRSRLPVRRRGALRALLWQTWRLA